WPGGVSGLQPHLVAECAVEADEGRPRARRCAGAAEIQRRGIQTAARTVSRRTNRAGAVSGQVAPPCRLERRPLQRPLCRHLQRPAAPARAAVWLAPARLLYKMRFTKAHAYGNDFIYVRRDAVAGVNPGALIALARELCDRHTGIGGDGLILYELTADGGSMVLFNADGSRAEVSGNGVRGLGTILLRDGLAQDGDTITIHTEAGSKWLTRTVSPDAKETRE